MKIADIDSLLEISSTEAAAIGGSGFFGPITAALATITGLIVSSNSSPNGTAPNSNQELPPDFSYTPPLNLNLEQT